MTVDLDERRPDHTRPTIAFITLVVAAAAVMTAGMTGNQPETPIAVDRPPLIAPAVPAPSVRPSPEPPAFPEFSMADVVTLAAAKVEASPRPKRTKPRRDAGSGQSPTAAQTSSATATAGGTTSDARSTGGSGSGSGTTKGSRTGGGSGATGTQSASSGSSTAGSSRTRDAGPGRSTTGQGKARGQRDATPGRSGSAKKQGRR